MTATAENFRKFAWSGKRLLAAELIAEDELTDTAIAERVGISDRQLRTWKKHPVFQAKVGDFQRALEQSILRYPIAKKRRRVQALNARWEKMQQLIAARGELLADEIKGGETGLLTRTTKVIGSGANQQIIEEYAFDVGLMRELRETEKQAAQEAGQWVDKGEVKIEDAALSDDERASRIAALLDRARARRAGSTPDGDTGTGDA